MASLSPKVQTGTIHVLLEDDPKSFSTGPSKSTWQPIDGGEFHINPTKSRSDPSPGVTLTLEQMTRGHTFPWPYEEKASVVWGLIHNPMRSSPKGTAKDPLSGEILVNGPTKKKPVRTYIFSIMKERGSMWHTVHVTEQNQPTRNLHTL